QFIKEISDALDCSDDNEKRLGLRKAFAEWGSFIASDVIIGGAVTIKNWSKNSNENKSRLMTYIQWGIEYARSGKSPVFSDALLSDFPQFEASKKDMRTIGELYEWLNDIYNYKCAEIISYQNLRHSYRLLDEDLVKRVFQCLNHLPQDRPIKRIPQIPNQYDQHKFSEWIRIPKPPLLLYARDWIYELSLRHGILLKRAYLGHSEKACLKFSKDPKIMEMNNITVSLTQPSTQQDAYLFNNGIIIKESDELDLKNIPFCDDILEFNHPLENFQPPKEPSKTVYCQIIAKMAKISFELENIKPLEQVPEFVNISLESSEPYKNLRELFSNNYGHLIPRTLTLGGKLSIEFKSCDIPENTIVPQIHSDDKFDAIEIRQILASWDHQYKHFNTKIFAGDGEIVNRDNIDNWWKTLKSNPSKWKILSYEDWTPVYKILKKAQSKDVKELLNDKYRIVFNGDESLQRNDQTVVNIKFPGAIDNNYQIYGSAAKRNQEGNWEKIQGLKVRFRYTNKYGCNAILIKSSETKFDYTEVKIFWFVISNPRGTYTNKYRNIQIAYGKQNIYNSQTEISLKCNDLCDDYILVTSFTSQTQRDTSFHTIKLSKWTTSLINLEIKKEINDDILEQSSNKPEETNDLETSGEDSDLDAINPSDQFQQETIKFQWCIVYTSGNELADNELVDSNEIFPWNVFGIILDPLLKQDHGITFIEPNYPLMTFEEATKQHLIPNGNIIDAWRVFVYRAKKNDYAAKYWVGFYLQNDILKNSDFYNREEVLEGLNIQQAAMKFYKSAADNGHHEAQLKYGYGLFSGKGVHEDKQMALVYFEQSANNGNVVAMYNLGAIYVNGREREKGKNLLIKAAKLG
ncbi:2649_t:CDS:2, partial [Racocetra persica]